MASDPERLIADCIAAFYEAATGHGDWSHAQAQLCALIGAESLALMIDSRPGRTPRRLMGLGAETSRIYNEHFLHIDPYLAAARTRPAPRGTVVIGDELLARKEFIATSYYRDFALPLGHDHMMGAVLDTRRLTTIAAYRDGIGFGESDRRRLKRLLGHLERSVALHHRFVAETVPARVAAASLDLLPFGILIVEADRTISFGNAWVEQFAQENDGPLTFQRTGSVFTPGVRFGLRNRDTVSVLDRYIAQVVTGQSGGACIACGANGERLSLHITPVPETILRQVDRDPDESPRLAMITIQCIGASAPSADMLANLFGLTRSEAEVAIALHGGRSADEVARRRAVSLETVRSQIRGILTKSGATNLRELEQILSSFSALT